MDQQFLQRLAQIVAKHRYPAPFTADNPPLVLAEPAPGSLLAKPTSDLERVMALANLPRR